MSNNIKLTIAYDGANYSGWQRQADKSTIQEVLEDNLSKICKEEITIYGSGRTDAGVHALGQTANFKTRLNLAPYTWLKAINCGLPYDVVVKSAEIVDNEFHARFSAREKHYRYRIYNAPFHDPFERNYAWHYKFPLDIEKMREAALFLLGEHDFSSFQGTGSEVEHSVRKLTKLDISQNGNIIQFDIAADGFLRHMVRNIAGTLAQIGGKKFSPEKMEEILKARDRSQAGTNAPPQGLYLVKVEY